MTLEHVSKSYRLGESRMRVINDVSLSVHAGEMLAILGKSGSGKSTLMHIMGLLDRADSGQYRFQTHTVSELSADALAMLRNRCFGFVFQQFHLLPRLSALQNVTLPLLYQSMPAADAIELAHNALRDVSMAPRAHHKPNQLSGGQQQRVAIARAIVTNPEVILADEPTGSLDVATGHEVMALFEGLHDQGKTIIMVTHDEQLALRCQRQIHIVDGQVAEFGVS